jgi:excisionase family DNA binding protein
MKCGSRFLRIADVAVELGLSVSRTYELAREGRIPAIRQGRGVRIPAEAFERWMEGRVEAALAALRVDREQT